jgi:hypothetical protein
MKNVKFLMRIKRENTNISNRSSYQNYKHIPFAVRTSLYLPADVKTNGNIV